jgi:membrane-bound inhibitor of C-type lysozyme
MKRIFLIPLLMLAGCEYGPPMPNGEQLPIANATFACADGSKIVGTFNEPPRTARLEWPGQRILELPQQWTGSGARYADARGEFWNKGREATWTPAGGAAVLCKEAAN